MILGDTAGNLSSVEAGASGAAPVLTQLADPAAPFSKVSLDVASGGTIGFSQGNTLLAQAGKDVLVPPGWSIQALVATQCQRIRCASLLQALELRR